MRTWSSEDVPHLDGGPGTLQLFDTRQAAIAPFVPGSDTFRMYVCGITPYDAAHLGHASTYVAFDTVQRLVRDAGYEVRYVQNVTDVDDPLLERANKTGDDWHALAERETQRFRDDMTALRVLGPDEFVGAVEAIPRVVALVQRLQELGAAYQVETDWYFSVQADPAFGSVGNFDEATMVATFAERGGDPERDGKKHPLDCLLWQGERPGEPSWESPLGAGRPGWHIECVAIAVDGLGTCFDLQGGGSDLVFPHHEMCASLARTLNGEEFAAHYAHTGMVALEGEKMSKSKGNLEFVSRLRSLGHDPAAIRLALLAHHYRSDWEWTNDELIAAEARLAAWRSAFAKATSAPADEVVADVRGALAHDLDTPRALAAIDAWSESEGNDTTAPTHVARLVDALLGIPRNASVTH